MSSKVWRFVPIGVLCLFVLLAWSYPSSVRASTLGLAPTNYAPEHIVLSQAREGQFLTGPAAGDAYKIALDFITREKDQLSLNGADLNFVVTDRYTSAHTGVTHLYFQQQVNGLLVRDAFINVNVTADGRILNLGSSFVSDVAQKVTTATPDLTASEAVALAADSLGLTITTPLSVVRQTGGVSQATELSQGGISLNNIPGRLVYHPVSASEVRLAWDLVIYPLDAQNWWNIWVDANTGQVLSQVDWVNQEHWGEAEHADNGVTSDEGGTELATSGNQGPNMAPDSYDVFAIPDESPIHSIPPSPADGRIVVANPANATASPFGWHDTNGAAGAEFTTTQGNNVHAYTDTDANNVPDAGSSPDGGASLDFLFPLDLTQAPSTYRPAAVTNLFYANNIIHDVLYGYGFDEAGGNFQQNNYGNGGLGNDYVLAEAQDGSGTNNANFSTPPDGSSGRMQMYLWNTTTPGRDGDFDNGIIFHEYGHGVSNRLTGGPSQAGCLGNAEQMGEGWSDLMSLFFSAKVGDTGPNGRGIGTYALGQPITGQGIRPARYSTDLGQNNFTYANVGSVAIPHGVGFVWATMYWEVYWNLVTAHGFNTNFYGDWTTGGNNLAMQLLVDGMKMQPCGPGFVDGRDAILAADLALTGGENYCSIWAGFAKRGLGFSASQGSSNSTSDGTAASDMPQACTTLGTIPSPAVADVCAGSAASYNIGVGTNFTPPVTMSGSVVGAVGTAVTFTPNPVPATLPQVIDMNITTTAGTTAAGSYTVNVNGTGGISANITTTLNVYVGAAAAPTLATPANGATGVSSSPSFTWNAAAQAISYTLQVDDNADFSSIEYEIVTTGTNHDVPVTQPLDFSTTYYWRVNASNICGNTNSSTFSFTTGGEPGSCDPTSTTVVAYTTDFESGTAGWTSSGTGNTWALSGVNTTSGVNAFHAVDTETLSDQRLVSPAIVLPSVAESPITLRFQNRQYFETPNTDGRCWDAGILEISTNGGSTWTQVPNSALLTDPYDNIIWNDTPGNNPITLDYGATQAWCDPAQAFLNNVVLLDAYAGQTVNFRFRLGSDSAAGNEGWTIDDVSVQSCSTGPTPTPSPTATPTATPPPTDVQLSNVGGNQTGSGWFTLFAGIALLGLAFMLYVRRQPTE